MTVSRDLRAGGHRRCADHRVHGRVCAGPARARSGRCTVSSSRSCSRRTARSPGTGTNRVRELAAPRRRTIPVPLAENVPSKDRRAGTADRGHGTAGAGQAHRDLLVAAPPAPPRERHLVLALTSLARRRREQPSSTPRSAPLTAAASLFGYASATLRRRPAVRSWRARLRGEDPGQSRRKRPVVGGHANPGCPRRLHLDRGRTVRVGLRSSMGHVARAGR